MSTSATRRDFLGTVAAVGALPMAAGAAQSGASAETAEWPRPRPATTYRLYLGRSGATVNRRTGSSVQYPTWSPEEAARMDDHLRGIEKTLGDLTFIGGETIPPAEVDRVAARAAAADGLLLIWLSGHGRSTTAIVCVASCAWAGSWDSA